jgi:NitT/TauT family transport system permease protein
VVGSSLDFSLRHWYRLFIWQKEKEMNDFIAAFTPNRAVSKSTIKLIVGVQIVLFILLWMFSPFPFLPTIGKTWEAFVEQWGQGLPGSLVVSFFANLQAIGYSCVISLGLAYLTTMEAFRPMVSILSKFRFLSMVGLSFFFTVATSSAHQLKLSLLVFSISVFFVTGMADVISSIPKEQYDLARTLRMGPWRTVYEVVVLGQIDKGFDVLRQNAAIGWMMLTMIESMVRVEGGIGAMLTTANKHFYLDAVFAIQITILLLGLFQDYMIGVLKGWFCPYADMGSERK